MLSSCLSLLSLTPLGEIDPLSTLLRHGGKGQPTSKVTQSRSDKDEVRKQNRHDTHTTSSPISPSQA